MNSRVIGTILISIVVVIGIIFMFSFAYDKDDNVTKLLMLLYIAGGGITVGGYLIGSSPTVKDEFLDRMRLDKMRETKVDRP